MNHLLKGLAFVIVLSVSLTVTAYAMLVGITFSNPSGGGGGGGAVLAAPITSAGTDSPNAGGNYATGCAGSPGAASGTYANHSCLMFDDHWTAGSLNTTDWFPGIVICGGGGGDDCLIWPGADTLYPFSGFGSFDSPGYDDLVNIGYPYGYATNPSGAMTHNALSVAGDGTLQMESKFYGQSTVSSISGCVAHSNSCSWLGGAITAGGLLTSGGGACNTIGSSCRPGHPANLNAVIPITGGLWQVRIKQDAGLKTGVWNGMECDAVGNMDGTYLNANMEWGYLLFGPTRTSFGGFGLGMNNTANQVSNAEVTTGDDGVGSGDLRNWHTFGIEWTGSATHKWNYYIDGVAQPVGVTHDESHQTPGNLGTPGDGALPTVGFNCKVYQLMANDASAGFLSQWNPASPGGPFDMWVSDAQVYKRPGT